MSACSSPAELFRSSWSLYDLVLRENYMFHREIGALVTQVARGHAQRGPFAVLDLGCGNARVIASALRAAPPRSYLGVDLSRAALDAAAGELAGVPEFRLVEQDMLACMEAQVADGLSLDFIHTAFAMHHLSTADKGRLFRAMAQALASEGSVLVVDIVREPGQTREDYLRGYMRMVETEWGALSPEQVGEVREHITAYDFPETTSDLTALARDAGLVNGRTLAQYRQHAVLLYRRG